MLVPKANLRVIYLFYEVELTCSICKVNIVNSIDELTGIFCVALDEETEKAILALSPQEKGPKKGESVIMALCCTCSKHAVPAV